MWRYMHEKEIDIDVKEDINIPLWRLGDKPIIDDIEWVFMGKI